MKAEIVATGTELLLGQITDTNTPFLADQLALLGVDVYYTCCVGDNHERMLGVLRQAWERSDLVLTTGGLGPTGGDITRDAIAGLVGEVAHVDSNLKSSMEAYFARRGLGMPANNLKQATLIPSAQAIPNPHGTAPGWWVEKAGRTIIALPGPPRELQPMWQSYVLPRLEQKSGAIIVSRMIKTFGVSESRVDELVSGFTSCRNPTLAMYAKNDGIYLRVTAKAPERGQAEAMIAQRECDLKRVLGEYIWGAGDDTLENVVGSLLKPKGLSLAVAETAFSGGFLIHVLANGAAPESYFRGGVVSTDCGEGADAVSGRAVRVRRQFEADFGLAIGGQIEAADGIRMGRVFVAITNGRGISRVDTYSGIYPHVRNRAAYFALFDLRKVLINS